MESDPLILSEREKFKLVQTMAHQKPAEDVIKELNTNIKEGLTQCEANRRLKVFGENALSHQSPPTMWEQIMEQFEDNLVRILLVAAVISFFIVLTGEGSKEWTSYVEPAVILLILVANATIGVWQEMKSEKALDALMELQANKAHVLREGKLEHINAAEIVPGDVCVLKGGDIVPADLRVVKVMALRVNQSNFTGEPKEVAKNPNILVTIPDATNQDKINLMFSSTEVTVGETTGVVIATGELSQLGKIKKNIEEAGEANKKTPLKIRLDEFGDLLSWIIMIICALAWLINFRNFFDPIHGNFFRGAVYYFKIAVSLAVAAIPEGLPAVITTCLALATTRMAKNNAIVRQLASVETLGCTTVICSDKTGTLTINKMTVVELSYIENDGRTIASHMVSGEGLHLEGKVLELTPEKYADNYALKDIARICSLCNDARLTLSEGRHKLKIAGSATEGALRVLVEKLSSYDLVYQKKPKEEGILEGYAKYFEKETPLVSKLPFTQSRKLMSVFVKEQSGTNVLLLKGAPDMLLARCTKVKTANGECVELTPELKSEILSKIRSASQKAYRCLGFAIKTDLRKEYESANEKDLEEFSGNEEKYGEVENEATFLGYVGIKDPPRAAVPDAIRKCKEAGIRVIMITGDNKDTAVAIARELGIIEPQHDKPSSFLDGREFDALGDIAAKKKKLADGACVFSRVEPSHKQQLVAILSELGEIVAMTGDGVNDAPAIRQAHIGISMGLSGTDVAKEASKLVLADDNFATIVLAIEEGRGIYSNIKAFIRYLISSNIGEVVAIFITSALGFPEVLSSVHLLWVNLVTDGLPATALGFNPPEPDAMKQKPRKSDENLIGRWTLVRYFVIGTYVGLATIAIFIHWFLFMQSEDGHTLISWEQLTNWSECPAWSADKKVFKDFGDIQLQSDPCQYFVDGKVKASTLSLTVLVVIEMFNAMNSLSEQSLFRLPLWKNPWLCLAIFSSMSLHFLILYVPFFTKVFGVAALTMTEWKWVLIYSAPILLIDEIMKCIGSFVTNSQQAKDLIQCAEEQKAKIE